VQHLLGCTPVDDGATHRGQRRAEQLTTAVGDPRAVCGVSDEALRLVDSIREARQPVTRQINLSHAGVQALKGARILVRRDVVRGNGFAIGPQRDGVAVLLVDARLRPRAEPHQRGAGPVDTPSDLHLELGDVPSDARRDASEHVTRSQVHCEPVRIAQHDPSSTRRPHPAATARHAATARGSSRASTAGTLRDRQKSFGVRPPVRQSGQVSSALAVPHLSDGVVFLRPPEEGDAEQITAACQDPDVSRFTAMPSPYERHHATDWIASAPESWQSGASAPMVIVEAATNKLVGACGLLEMRDRHAEIGYWVQRQARGQGFATRAVVLVTTWGLDDLGLSRIELHADVRNLASQRVAEKAGYTRIGEVPPPARCLGRSEVMVRFVRSVT
jgi:RimJ/RimL family protein N-acetyltransferase